MTYSMGEKGGLLDPQKTLPFFLMILNILDSAAKGNTMS